MPLVLDTNIVRHLAEGEVPLDGLYALRNEGTTIHVAEGAAVELVCQLVEGRLTWKKWLRARRILGELLCKKSPVLLGREIRGSRGVFADPHPPEFSVGNPACQHRVRYSWQFLMKARQPDDLLVPFHVPPTGEVVGLGRPSVPAAGERTRQSWTSSIAMLRSSVGYEGGRSIERSRVAEGLEAMVKRFAIGLDADVRGKDPPESIRWDAEIHVVVLYAIRSLQPREPYNAEKNRNDSFDIVLLRYLAFPAAICTRDRRLLSALADSRAWQARWVVTPESLSTAAGRRVVADLRWPTHS